MWHILSGVKLSVVMLGVGILTAVVLDSVKLSDAEQVMLYCVLLG